LIPQATRQEDDWPAALQILPVRSLREALSMLWPHT